MFQTTGRCSSKLVVPISSSRPLPDFACDMIKSADAATLIDLNGFRARPTDERRPPISERRACAALGQHRSTQVQDCAGP
jgi:hypothetical protein